MTQMVPYVPFELEGETQVPTTASLLAKEWEKIHELRRRAHKLRLAPWPWVMQTCGGDGSIEALEPLGHYIGVHKYIAGLGVNTSLKFEMIHLKAIH